MCEPSSSHSPSPLPAPCAGECRAWVALVGLEAAQQKLSVCIGSTSAKACQAAGLTKVVHPEDPGIPGWVDCVLEAMGQKAAHV